MPCKQAGPDVARPVNERQSWYGDTRIASRQLLIPWRLRQALDATERESNCCECHSQGFWSGFYLLSM